MNARHGRVVARCAACYDPIREDEPATLTNAGALVHRRCGGSQVGLDAFTGP